MCQVTAVLGEKDMSREDYTSMMESSELEPSHEDAERRI